LGKERKVFARIMKERRQSVGPPFRSRGVKKNKEHDYFGFKGFLGGLRTKKNTQTNRSKSKKEEEHWIPSRRVQLIYRTD